MRTDVPDSRDSYIEADELGSGFWKMLIGLVIAVAIGAVLVFWLLSSAWARWGALGALVFCGALALAVGWFYDRRDKRRAG